MVAQQHGTSRDIILLRYLLHPILLKQRASRTAEGRIGLYQDTLFRAEVDNILLREVWVIFNLIRCRGDGGDREDLLEEFDAVVGDANGANLIRSRELLELLPCLQVRPAFVKIAGAVRVFGEFLVVACASRAISDQVERGHAEPISPSPKKLRERESQAVWARTNLWGSWVLASASNTSLHNPNLDSSDSCPGSLLPGCDMCTRVLL